MVLLLLACTLLFFFRLGVPGIIDPGDGYYSEGAREMLERGDFSAPFLNYQLFYAKPILIYWLICSAYATFGITAFAARFWSAAAATISVFTLWWTTRRLVGNRAALYAGLILASCPLVIMYARLSLIDMTFMTLLTVSFCAMALAVLEGNSGYWSVLYVALGLAVLAKGPAALPMIVTGTFGFFASRKPLRSSLICAWRLLKPHLGVLIVCAVALPWYLVISRDTDGLWPRIFIGYENLMRISGQVNHRHPEYLFYLIVLAYGFFPWIFFLPAVLGAIRKGLLFRAPLEGAICSQSRTMAYQSFLCWWLLPVFVALSLAPTKMQSYILPAFPALAALTAICLADERDVRSRLFINTCKTLMVLGLILSVTTCATLLCVPELHLLIHKPAKVVALLQEFVGSLSVGEEIALICAAFISSLGLFLQYAKARQGKKHTAVQIALLTVVAAASIVAPIGFESVYRLQFQSLRRLTQVIPADARVAVFKEFRPSLIFYLRRPVDTFFAAYHLLPAQERTPLYIFVEEEDVASLLQAHGGALRVVQSEGRWSVLRTESLQVYKYPSPAEQIYGGVNLGDKDATSTILPFSGGAKQF